jgi:hypothetical protein
MQEGGADVIEVGVPFTDRECKIASLRPLAQH